MLWTLQRACEIQPAYGAGQDVFDALVRQVDRLDKSYQN